MDKTQPVVLNIPRISQGLRDLVIRESCDFAPVVDEMQSQQDTVDARARLEQAQEEADRILEKAKQDAAGILEDAKSNAEKLLKQAKDDGMKQAKAEAEKAGDLFRKNLEAVYRGDLQKQKEEFADKVQALEDQILEISLAVAEKVITYELAEKEEAVQAIVQDALNQISMKQGIVVKAAKANCEIIEKMESIESDNIRVLPQEGWSKGTFKIESLSGNLDFGVETKMKCISQVLYGELA